MKEVLLTTCIPTGSENRQTADLTLHQKESVFDHEASAGV